MGNQDNYGFEPGELLIAPWSKDYRSPWIASEPTGIQVVHLPTGNVVQFDRHKSPHRNKHEALSELRRRLDRDS